MTNTYSFLSLQNVFILIIKFRCVSCSEYSLFKKQQGPLWGCGSREWGSCPVFSLGPSLTAQGRTSCLAWKRRHTVASVVPANGPRGRKASLLGITGTFHPHGLRRGCYQGDELLVPREIPSMDEGISSVKGQGRGTSHQWAGDHSCPLRKKVKKKQSKSWRERHLCRGKEIMRERTAAANTQLSPRCYTENLASAATVMHPYTPAVNKCGQVDVKLYDPARGLGKEELRTCLYQGIKSCQLEGPVCYWAWKKLRQQRADLLAVVQGPLISQPGTFDQNQRVLLEGIWK